MWGKILTFSDVNTKIAIRFVKPGLYALIEAEISFEAEAANGWAGIWDTDFRSVDRNQKAPSVRNGTRNWAGRYKSPEKFMSF